MNFNKFQKEQVNKDEMKALTGGWRREVTYEKEGDISVKVVRIYDNAGNIKRETRRY